MGFAGVFDITHQPGRPGTFGGTSRGMAEIGLGEEGGLWSSTPPSLTFGNLLAQRREVDHRAADEGPGDLERSLPGGDGGEDIVVFAQLDGSDTRVPVKDLQIPRTSGITDLSRNEVEHVATGAIVREGGQQTGTLHCGRGSVSANDVVHDVALAEQLGRLR